jgi:hypothetical protein
MANVRIVLNRAGVRELLRSDEMEAELLRRANNIANAAGPGHRVESRKRTNRARAAVITDTADARLAQATSNTLGSALDAGRG